MSTGRAGSGRYTTDGSGDEGDGNAGFLRAARDGNLEEVVHFLRTNVDINTSNPNGLNALHLASKEGHTKVVAELLRRGANVEAATKKGNTSLHIASLAGHEDIVRRLVESGAQVNLQAQAGFTPLYMASQEGHAEVVRYLLNNGANPGLSTEDGFTPLAVALQQGHDKVVSALLEHDAKGKVRLPALHIAAKKDDVKSAALLLQNEQNSVELQTKSGFTPLHIAAHYGNINVANLLVQRNADVNFKAKNHITPLHVASRWGKLNMVKLLLENNANIDEKTRDGLTPLHCAARSGHETVVDLLLERGAPNSAKTKNGLTPLHMAAQGDHEDCARLLLYHKASLNEVTIDYLTPLHVAAHCGNVKTAKLLLDRKCEPNARALNGFTPLHIACKKNRIKVVELLLKYGASIESKTESGLTPLHVASFMGHMNIVIYLIQHNANPNTTTVRGETSLHLAARANQSDIIRILLRNGATVDARAREQQTPLHIAARLGNVDNVVLLLQHGALVDAATKDKYTPLHIAAKEGHDEVAQVLLEQEAQMDATTKKGFTPLHIAAKYGNIKVARLLLQKGADPNVQGKNGLTPLHVATHYNHANVAQLLLEKKADPHATAKNGYTPLHIAAKKNQMDIATMLLEYGARPNADSKNGFTPLHLASQEGHTDIVSLLLQKDANVNCQAQNGLTPMHLAAQEDRVAVAEILVKYGSDTDTSTKAGYTPLHTACHFGQINMVRFLLNHGTSVNATTKAGYTPLHQAAQQGHVQVVSLLLKNQASPNAVTSMGQTPLAIAQKLGYVSVVDILKPVTDVQLITPATEDKYKVLSPETMQEAFISDSDDEGDDKRHSYMSNASRDDSISLERGGSTSPLDVSFDKDVQLRHPATDSRGRQISQIGATMHYPSYLESGPDYEAEMRYYHGDTLSPKDKSGLGDQSRTDSVFYSGDYSTLGSNRDSLSLDGTRERSTGGSTADIFGPEDDDLKYVADDQFLRKEYMDAQLASQSFHAIYNSAPPITDYLPVGKEATHRYSSYSGSSFSTNFDPDNVPVDRSPVYSGFLISFMVDARGGAMRGCRHPGVRIIIPPRKCCMPTRITCRLVHREKLLKPPPMLEGEGLAARVLEMGPVGTKFLGPVLIEVPHFASLRGKEREVIILRSDNGESWYEHPVQATEDAVTEALGSNMEGGLGGSQPSVSSLWQLDSEEDLSKKRIKRILTTDLPQYFALVSRVTRVKQESIVIGIEGGVLSSNVVPQVQAVLPEGTLTRPIPVGLQAQPIAPDLVAKLLGNRVAVSPIVTIEPRRRKFHKPITLTIPVPKAAQKGMINQYGGDRPTLRLLFSLAADPNPAQWEDVTDSKPMTLVDDCVSFTTTVSARFWLIDCPNISEAAQMASVLYQEAVTVPYMAKFVVFAKRDSPEEGKLRIFCMTDDKDDKTLEKQEKFFEVARSRDIEVLEGRPQFVEMAGNLVPVTKSGDQLQVNFRAFRENRLPSTVKVRDLEQEASARVAFMKEPKVARGEAPQTPICNLNIRLPDMISSGSDLDIEKAADILQHHDFLPGKGLVVQGLVSRSEMKLSDVAEAVQGDWVVLAQQLQVSMTDINQIKNRHKTSREQALAMLHFWTQRNPDRATDNQLESALRKINREDVVRTCIYRTVIVDDEEEAARARVDIERPDGDTYQSAVDVLRESLNDSESMVVQYDDQESIRESELTVDEISLAGKERIIYEEDHPDRQRSEFRYQEYEEVQTPPPSPTEHLDTEEPVLTTRSSMTEVATRLGAREREDSGGEESEGQQVVEQWARADSQAPTGQVETTLREHSYQETHYVTSQSSSQTVTPSSETGSYREEPAAIPEPRIPEGFRTDELIYQRANGGDDEDATTDDGTAKYEDARDESFRYSERLADFSSDADTYRTANQSLENTLDYSRYSDMDGGRYEYPQGLDETDLQEKTVVFREEFHTGETQYRLSGLDDSLGRLSHPYEEVQIRARQVDEHPRAKPRSSLVTHLSENVGSSVDYVGSSVDPIVQSADSYPEATFTVEFVKEESADLKETGPDSVRISDLYKSDTYDQLTAGLGSQEYVDRREEILPTIKATLSEEEVFAKYRAAEVATSPTYESLVGTALVVDESALDEENEGVNHQDTSRQEIVTHFQDQAAQPDEVQVDEHEEVLPDGTVHHTRRVRSTSFKVEQAPKVEREDVVETFNEPPRFVSEAENVEQIGKDGVKVQRTVIYNRVVHHSRTHQESYDPSLGRQVEEFEISEVIPGTMSAFVAGSDSSESEYSSEGEEAVGTETRDTQERQGIRDDEANRVSKRITSGEDTEGSSNFQESVKYTTVSTQRVQVEAEEFSSRVGTSSSDYEGRSQVSSSDRTQAEDLADGREPHSISHGTDDSLEIGGSESYHSSNTALDDDSQTHRLMMKKELHKRTLYGPDGQEHTSVYEDSQVQQDTEPPEELRDSMQQIINQFMEMPTHPINLPLLESQEDEV